MGKAPAFQLFAADLYMDTNHWTVDEIGIYTRLLMTEWVNGGLPDDLKRLARIAGCSPQKFSKRWTIVKKKFHQNNEGFLINDRMEQTREEQANYKKSQSEKGKKSCDKRWHSDITVVTDGLQPEGQPKHNSSSSSSSSNKKKRLILSDEDFLKSLKEKFTWVDFDTEMTKIDAWLMVHTDRKKTRGFIVKWISKIQKPMETKNVKSW